MNAERLKELEVTFKNLTTSGELGEIAYYRAEGEVFEAMPKLLTLAEWALKAKAALEIQSSAWARELLASFPADEVR